VAAVLGAELGWGAERTAREEQRFQVTAEAEGILPGASIAS
jgi:hypothetical protein